MLAGWPASGAPSCSPGRWAPTTWATSTSPPTRSPTSSSRSSPAGRWPAWWCRCWPGRSPPATGRRWRATTSALLTWTLALLVPLAVRGGAGRAVPVDRLLWSARPRRPRSPPARGCCGSSPRNCRCTAIGIVLTGVLQAHRRFAWPVLAPLLSSLTVIGRLPRPSPPWRAGAPHWPRSARPASWSCPAAPPLGVVVLAAVPAGPAAPAAAAAAAPAGGSPGRRAGPGRRAWPWPARVTVAAQQLALLVVLWRGSRRAGRHLGRCSTWRRPSSCCRGRCWRCRWPPPPTRAWPRRRPPGDHDDYRATLAPTVRRGAAAVGCSAPPRWSRSPSRCAAALLVMPGGGPGDRRAPPASPASPPGCSATGCSRCSPGPCTPAARPGRRPRPRSSAGRSWRSPAVVLAAAAGASHRVLALDRANSIGMTCWAAAAGGRGGAPRPGGRRWPALGRAAAARWLAGVARRGAGAALVAAGLARRRGPPRRRRRRRLGHAGRSRRGGGLPRGGVARWTGDDVRPCWSALWHARLPARAPGRRDRRGDRTRRGGRGGARLSTVARDAWRWCWAPVPAASAQHVADAGPRPGRRRRRGDRLRAGRDRRTGSTSPAPGPRFCPVEIPASPSPGRRPRRRRAAPGARRLPSRRGPRARAARRRWWPCWPGQAPARWWSPGTTPSSPRAARAGLAARGADRGPGRRRHPRRLRATWSRGPARSGPATRGWPRSPRPLLPPPAAQPRRGARRARRRRRPAAGPLGRPAAPAEGVRRPDRRPPPGGATGDPAPGRGHRRAAGRATCDLSRSDLGHPGAGDSARPPHRRGRPARRRRPGGGDQRVGGPAAVRPGGDARRRAAGGHRRRRAAGAGRATRRCWCRPATWTPSTRPCGGCSTTRRRASSTPDVARNAPPPGLPRPRPSTRCAASTRSWPPPATRGSDGSVPAVAEASVRWPSVWRGVGQRRPAVPYLVIAVAALAAVVGLAAWPAAPESEPAADYVVIAGAAGLRWERRRPAAHSQPVAPGHRRCGRLPGHAVGAPTGLPGRRLADPGGGQLGHRRQRGAGQLRVVGRGGGGAGPRQRLRARPADVGALQQPRAALGRGPGHAGRIGALHGGGGPRRRGGRRPLLRPGGLVRNQPAGAE